MPPTIHKLVVGSIESNCYILTEGNEAIVIDPGGDPQLILDKLKASRTKVTYIVNTHGHIDHIAANAEIKNATGAEILIHKKDAFMLADGMANLSSFFSESPVTSNSADRLLEDGDDIEVGNLKLKVIHTPGHTQGGICLLGDKKIPNFKVAEDVVLLTEDSQICEKKTCFLGNGFVFTGDTLFESGIGRTDLPGGCYKTIIDSITKHLLVLKDETVIYPGHGNISTIGRERRNNPFLK